MFGFMSLCLNCALSSLIWRCRWAMGQRYRADVILWNWRLRKSSKRTETVSNRRRDSTAPCRGETSVLLCLLVPARLSASVSLSLSLSRPSLWLITFSLPFLNLFIWLFRFPSISFPHICAFNIFCSWTRALSHVFGYKVNRHFQLIWIILSKTLWIQSFNVIAWNYLTDIQTSLSRCWPWGSDDFVTGIKSPPPPPLSLFPTLPLWSPALKSCF